MRILLVHQNFPGQFKHIVPALLARGDEVVAMGMGDYTPLKGMRYVRSHARMGTGKDGHPWSRDFDTKVIRGEATFRSAMTLREAGFTPDIIIAHPGWGESLFLHTVWPGARIGLYSEFFYRADGADTNFDPEFPTAQPEEQAARLFVKNAGNYLSFQHGAQFMSPTHWQAASYPEWIQPRIAVIHDGVDTLDVKPNPDVSLRLSNGLNLTRDDEVITYVARNLEPYRGYHKMMRALPDLMKLRPNAHFIVVGGDGTSYGALPPAGKSWKQIYLEEVEGHIDRKRLHFVGHLPYSTFKALLALSRVHVYLTVPFVLSWSLLEAMATGCAIVGSDTPPVRELITSGVQGKLVSFHDVDQLIAAVADLCQDAEYRAALGHNARERIVREYDLHSVCLPRQLAWIDGLSTA
jgi:glycosyltransferase involved in cell wall biosynthesis